MTPSGLTLSHRRQRLGIRHALAPVHRVSTPVDVAEALVVLHATDPASVYLSTLARLIEPELEALDRALYRERQLVRLLAMRRTLFVVSARSVALVERAASDAVARRERQRLVSFVEDSGLGDGGAWLDGLWDEVSEVIRGSDDGLSARQISERVPRLATRIRVGGKSKWGMDVNATSKVLGVWAAEGRIVRGRPAGSWTSRLHSWHARDAWLGGSADGDPKWNEETASVELVRRWLSAFGPGTLTDLKWWTGWTMGKLKAALSQLDVIEVEIEQDEGHFGPGLLLADDGLGGDEEEPDPWAALLPSLDPTPMGWKERSWFLGPHAPRLFDRNGNVGPTIWLDGRIVGGWSQVASGEIVTGILEDVGADAEALIAREVERLQLVLGDTVVKPSFPTPLQKELEAG